MMDSIQKEIDAFYAKYASKEGITLAEAKRRVSKLDMDEYSRKAKKYVADRDFSKQANQEMRLYNLTMKVNRLELLKANIGMELSGGFDEMQKFFEQTLNDRTMEEFARQAGILGKSVQNNARRAHAIVNASFHNATYSDRIWMHQDLLKAEISKQLERGLIQGKGSRDLARELRKTFDVSRSDAERLMTTELRRVQTEAAKQSYERNGNKEYTFLTTNPKGPCEVCKKLDGRHFKVIDMMPGKNAPPMHPRCHCTTAPHWDQEEFDRWLDEENRKMHERIRAETVAKGGKDGIIKLERPMANGMRKSYLIPMSEEDKSFVIREAKSIGIDTSVIRFRDGYPTAYSDERDIVFVSSSVFPSEDGSMNPTDLLSVRATLAHEYYGHRAYRNTRVPKGAWNDEFRASYMAALNCPNLSNEDKAMLIADAIERAKKSGVSIRYNSFMRRCLYGYE